MQLTPFAAKLADLGFNLTTGNSSPASKGPTLLVSGTLAACHKYMSTFNDLAKEAKINGEKIGHYMTRDSDDFCGGTFDELMRDANGRVDMEPFRRAAEDMSRSGILDKLQTTVSDCAPRRRRKLSEHDGEWDYDRRWDMEPFHDTERAPSPTRIVEIDCYMGVSYHVEADDLARYGTLVWSIADIVERSGIQTGITAIYSTTDFTRRRESVHMSVHVKRPGQYVAPSILASVCRPYFFRRAIFSMYCACAESIGSEVRKNLGISFAPPERIKFDLGKLTISPEVRKCDPEEIEREVLAAIRSAKPGN